MHIRVAASLRTSTAAADDRDAGHGEDAWVVHPREQVDALRFEPEATAARGGMVGGSGEPILVHTRQNCSFSLWGVPT